MLAFATVCIAACGGNKAPETPPGTVPPDQFLLQRANDAVKRQRWADARKYFQQIVDNYPQSTVRPDAKLGVGDTYLNEGGEANLVLAENEFKEFITFYPTSTRVDYSQYKLAMTHFKQMRGSERDQTETRDAIREFQTFLTRYGATSDLTPQVKARLREALDRLGKADFEVGLFYYRQKWYPGSIDRFSALLKSDPEYSSRGDVYFYLAESYVKLKGGREAQALPYYEKLVNEFPNNEHLQDAQKRIAELKAQQASNEKKS